MTIVGNNELQTYFEDKGKTTSGQNEGWSGSTKQVFAELLCRSLAFAIVGKGTQDI